MTLVVSDQKLTGSTASQRLLAVHQLQNELEAELEWEGSVQLRIANDSRAIICSKV